MPVSRRSFLSRSGAVAVSTVGFPSLVGASGERAARAGDRPRHIIHLVSDGMSLGTLTCTDQLSRLRRKRGLSWLGLHGRPGVALAWMNMRSLNSIVTDSSAASSSWGSGSRVVNGVLNQLPDGRNLRTLYSLFDEAGWKRGLVTTTEITHATPAGFAANDATRDAAETIAVQYLDRKIDVLLGGGTKFFDPSQRNDKRNLYADFANAGYVVMRSAADLAGAPLDRRWLGTFASSHLPYTIDHEQDAKLRATVPSLVAMTQAALGKLERESHFILQVEGGRVDHACHNCDAATAFREQTVFDEALDLCLAFEARHPDTLLVITTDHGNGNPGLNGMGDEYAQSNPLFANCQKVRRSFSSMMSALEKAETEEAVREIIYEATDYKVPAGKAAMLAPFLQKKGKTIYDLMNSGTAQLGQLMGNYLGIGWVGGAHTGDYVPLVALGPGAERFRGFIQNTDVFRHYLALARIDFRNPEVPLLAERGPSAARVERVGAYGESVLA